jgi:hypothetical protein
VLIGRIGNSIGVERIDVGLATRGTGLLISPFVKGAKVQISHIFLYGGYRVAR